ncbi:uncharacterized protein K452DRAFT_308023 [Aplosporella prunicola CBS 121167]|uniref:RRM domain-containing protein n=1 Tax=Aplosporella prunicola CBS 121167 TaxID=1176127 RepID=A0A6A6BDR4_9PEZI|nr:uncharacterized protein K452DRAFT_308023 [Aplosporella prunicola CBS 121167]KAF2142329.1 hypothetical protein K452DRAFT_308023 [Aplosporella prunicola CBS 121167]
MSDTEARPEEERPADVPEEDGNDEEDIAAMKKRVQEMEAEAAKLREMQASLDQQSTDLRENKEDIDARSVFVGNVDYGASPEEIQAHFQSCGSINRVTILLDKFTGHPKGIAWDVERAAPSAFPRRRAPPVPPSEAAFLALFFSVSITERSSLPGKSCAARVGTLMGVCRYAYVEFTEPSLVAQALVLNESVFRGRNLKVVPKRTNLPGMTRGRGRGGMRGGGGRGGFGRGGYGAPAPRGGYRGGYRPRGRGYAPY